MNYRLIAAALVATSALAADTNRIAQLYEEGIALYWSGKIQDAAMKMADVINLSDRQDMGSRAEYMLEVLESKLNSNEVSALRGEIHKQYPVAAKFMDARRGLATPSPETFAALVDFALVAPTPGWRDRALQALFSQDWSDEIIARRLEAATILGDLAHESAFQDNPARVQRLHGQLLKEYVARADYSRQIQLRERSLQQNPAPDAVIALMQVYRTAGRPEDGFAFFTNAIRRTTAPEALGVALVRHMINANDIESARAALAATKDVIGPTNLALRLLESRILEESYDFRGALALLEGDAAELKRARAELRQKLPAHYDLEWSLPIKNAEDVDVDTMGRAHVMTTGPGHPDTSMSVALIDLNGETLRILPLAATGGRIFPPSGSAGSSFLLLPDGGYLAGQTVYLQSGEVRQTLSELGSGHFMSRQQGGAAWSPTEGLAIAIVGQGLWRYGEDYQPIFKAMDPENTRQPFIGVVWQGTNIVLIDHRRATHYDNQGIRIGVAEYTGESEDMRFRQFSARGGRARTDSEGLIYIASPVFRGVRVYDADFRFLTHIRAPNVQSCAIAPDGTVYVLHDFRLSRFIPKDGGPRALKGKDVRP